MKRSWLKRKIPSNIIATQYKDNDIQIAYFPKNTGLRKKGKSDLAQCKDRIQKLLTTIVRIRDGGCIFRNYPEAGECSGYTAADHIISRTRAISYGDLRNVVCVCQRHHIYWKPQNPLSYSRIIKTHLKEGYNWIVRVEMDNKTYPMKLWDWLKIELALSHELSKMV